jgi:hypothetical protein
MIYLKIFDIDTFDTDLDISTADINNTDIDVGMTDNGYVYHFHGTVDVTTKEEYQYEKKHPVSIDKYFRTGKYFFDVLKISIVATPEAYENLYFASIRNNAYLIAWDTFTGFQYRWLRANLPYPSKVRFLNDKVDFTIETSPYFVINRSMSKDFMKNFRWNKATIKETVWN